MSDQVMGDRIITNKNITMISNGASITSNIKLLPLRMGNG